MPHTLRAAICCTLLALTATCAHAQAEYIITTIAGDSTQGYNGNSLPATRTELDGPTGVAVDIKGNVYISDKYNYLIRKIDTNGIIYTIAGCHDSALGYNGDNIPATQATIFYPYGIVVDSIGNVYFADSDNNRIRKIDTLGIIHTIAGNGVAGYNGDGIQATAAQIYGPTDMVFDNLGNMYLTDGFNNRVRKIDKSGIITTVAGTGTAGYSGDGAAATAAELNNLYGISIDKKGNLFVADYGNNRIRKISVEGIITTIAGTGVTGFGGDGGLATNAILSRPIGIAIDNDGKVYLSDKSNYRIRLIDTNGIINTFAGTGMSPYNGDNININMANIDPALFVLDNHGSLYIPDFNNNRIRYIRNPEGIKVVENPFLSLSVFPNPSSGNFKFLFNSNSDEKIEAFLTSAIGDNIMHINTTTNSIIPVNVNVPNGIYILQIITKQGVFNKKIIINR